MTTDPGQLEQLLGGPPLTVTLGGYTVPGAAVGPLDIRRGRADVDSRPDAASCSTELAVDQLTQLPQLGDDLVVRLSPAMLTYLGLTSTHQARDRFVGQVTDLAILPTSNRRPVATVRVTATGRRSRLGAVQVGAAAYPAELDGPRASRILTDAASRDSRITAGTVDPGAYQVNARAAALTDAQSLLDELAADTGGELVELRSGALAWRDSNARSNLPSSVELTATNILVPLTWAQKLAGMLTRLVLGYGTASPQDAVTVADPLSAAQVGEFAASTGSQLATSAAASTRATDLVGRRSKPRWRLDSVTVDQLRTVTVAQAAALAGLDFGDMLTLSGLPAAGPTPTTRAFLEGLSERWTRDVWQLSLDVSTYATTGPAPRWADVPTGTTFRRLDPVTRKVTTVYGSGGLTWSAVDTSVSWLTAVSWDPGDAGTARWADQSARLTWATTDTSKTWATY